MYSTHNPQRRAEWPFTAVMIVLLLTAVTPAEAADPDWENNSANPNEIYYDHGNVGIGIQDPKKKLDIVGGLRLSKESANSWDMYFFGRDFLAEKDILYLWGISNSTSNILRLGNNSSWHKAPTHLQFFTAENPTARGTLRMTINPFGAVKMRGPELLLYRDVNNDSVPLFHLRNTQTGKDWVFRHDENFLHIQTETSPGHEVMTLRSNGRVGIGRTDPQSALDVNGTVKATALDVAGNIEVGGNIVSDGDICIGACT